MNPSEIRRHVLVALYSDDVLTKKLVLKGGNALEIAHGLITRGSVDLDFSIEGEFENKQLIEKRLIQALQSYFSKLELVVFDSKFLSKPPIVGKDLAPWWGGYTLQFKLLEVSEYERLREDPAGMQREALPIDERQRRIFTIDISKYEYCKEKIHKEVGGQIVYVYTLEMIVFEKLRAICQQMVEYNPLPSMPRTRRARDFYDIYTTITKVGLDVSLPENLELCKVIFEAKKVDLKFLSNISNTRDYHESDWPSVRDAVQGSVLSFDVYFDFVVEQTEKLKPLWIE